MEIRAVELSKLYGDFPALQQFTLQAPAGDFIALLGRNGAGKTTLLKLLGLLTQPTFGTLTIGGVDAGGDTTELRRRLGFLGHHTFLYDDLTAEENLFFYAQLYGVHDPATAVRAMLSRVGLAPFSKELVRNYSRGMRQRLGIGRLFLHDPDLLLLDEPFNGLDDRAVLLLESLLQQARERGKTVVLCTHQLELGLKLAARLVILDRGKLAYAGPNLPDNIEEMRKLYSRFAG